MNLNDLHTFLLVAERGSLAEAAAALDVPKSTVSRRVSRLEADLGIDLLLRGGGAATLSPAGQRLFEGGQRPLQALLSCSSALEADRAEVRGTIRLSAPVDIAASPWFGRLVADYRRAHPEVRFDIVGTGRMVDLFQETFDLALRAHCGPLEDSTLLKVKRIGEMEISLYAAPPVATAASTATRPEALLQGSLVDLSAWDRWTLSSDGEEITLPVDEAVRCSDFIALRTMLVAGVGIGPLPAFVATPELRAERLCRVLPAWELAPARLSLVWPHQRRLTAKDRAFIDFVATRGLDGLLSL